MSERGVFAVDRGIWTDTDFADEQFSEREAFLWMLSEAAWRPTKVRIGAHVVDLARGQLAFSTRFMAAKWKWSEARVRRYLGRLISAEIICTTTDKIATHVTILKYDRFQRVSLPDAEVATHTRRTADAPTTHQRRKEEDRENKEVISSLRSETTPAPTARKRKIDPNWQLGPEEVAAAEECGVSPDRASQIWPSFIDHHVLHATLGLEWIRGWRTWCRNDVKFSARDAARAPRASPSRRGSTADAWATDAVDAHLSRTRGSDEQLPFFEGHDDWSAGSVARHPAANGSHGEPHGLPRQSSGSDPRQLPQIRLVGGRSANG